jgi:hypothetical protein
LEEGRMWRASGLCVLARTVNAALWRGESESTKGECTRGRGGGGGGGETHERTWVARAANTEFFWGGDEKESVELQREREARGVRIGREGRGRAGRGVDMERVGGTGRWWERSSFGGRRATRGGGGGGGGAPAG